jgi:hypothetical protein
MHDIVSMLAAINLDYELGGQRYEVQHISAKRVLPPDFELTERMIPQRSPKLAFRVRHAAPQILREATGLYRFVGLAQHL